MDWVKCNKCYAGIAKDQPPFSVTQCGHIFCSNCVKKMGDTCAECKTTGIRMILMTNPFPDQISKIFTPSPEQFESALVSLNFQNNQRNIILRRFNEMEKKYNALKNAYWQSNKKVEKLVGAYNQVQKTCNQYKEKLAKIQQQQQQSRNLMYSSPQVQLISNQSNAYMGPQVTNLRMQSQRKNTPLFLQDRRFTENLHARNQISKYRTDDSGSDSSYSTIRMTTPRHATTPDGLFRIPNPPRTGGTTSSASRSSTNPSSHMNIFANIHSS